jgi:hypothetical protein
MTKLANNAIDIRKQVDDSTASIVNGRQLAALPIRFFSYHKNGIITTAPNSNADW